MNERLASSAFKLPAAGKSTQKMRRGDLAPPQRKGTDNVDALTFQAEVRRIEKLMYHVSMSYLGNTEDASDAVQDTLVKAWEKQGRLSGVE